MLLGAIVGALLGLGMFLQAPKIYRAQVVLAIADPDGPAAGGMLQSLSSLSAIAGLSLGGGNDRRSRYIAFLKSRAFTTRLIEKNGWAPELFPERWDAARHSWRADAKPPTRADLFQRFDREVRELREDKFTGLVTLTVDWRDRKRVADWATLLVNQVNEELRAQAISDARRSINFLDAELDRTNSLEVKQSIYRIMEAQINAVMLANVKPDFAFQIVDPAEPSDKEKYIRPRLVFSVLGGALAGIALAALLAYGITMRIRLRETARLNEQEIGQGS